MSYIRHTLSFGVVFLTTAVAWADLAPSDRPGPAPVPVAAHPWEAPLADSNGLIVTGSFGGTLPAAGPGWPATLADAGAAWPEDSDRSGGGEVLLVPSEPDSAALFLWALGGLGAWQLGRYTRKWHIGALPEWYHTGGPQQIGHSHRLDPYQVTLDLPLWYEFLGGVPTPATPIHRFVDPPPPRPWGNRPLAAAARGPPWLS